MPSNKEYYNNNVEKYKQYYHENKEIMLKREQLYYQKNKEQILEKQRISFRKYYLLNQEKILLNCQRRYYGSISAIPEKIKPQRFYNEIINSNIIISLRD